MFKIKLAKFEIETLLKDFFVVEVFDKLHLV